MNQHCETCGERLNTSITDGIPTDLVQIGGYYIGKEVMIKDKYYHNRVWIENTGGEGLFMPLPTFEKFIGDWFKENF